jgi:dipeptidyl aminopeptidase/acylaminoacyl peptidase
VTPAIRRPRRAFFYWQDLRVLALWLACATVFTLAVAESAQATHVRPGGGTPWRVPLVPVYGQCTTAAQDSNHVAPLALDSCSSPTLLSPLLTTGNAGAQNGFVRLDVFCTDGGTPPCVGSAGDQADVKITTFLSDVRCAGLNPICPNGAESDYDPDPPPSPRITFATNRDGDQEIYTMAPDGTNPLRVTSVGGVDTEPDWAPGGDRITFTSQRDGNLEIYTMNANGALQARATVESASDIEPAWSPNGARIAFASARDGNEEIYAIASNGADPTRLTNDLATDRRPDWSPDSDKIVFQSNRDGNDEIYVMNADGTGVATRLTNDAAADGAPNWSPDGSQIAFQSDRDGNDEIYVMNADGTDPTRLTNDAAADRAPSFSPDGSQIAFQSDRDGNDEIYVMNADGTNQTNVTNDPASDVLPEFGLAPAGGPDDMFGSAVIRITDHANAADGGPTPTPCPTGSGNPPCVTATVLDLPFSVPLDCVTVGSPTFRPGSTCVINTSVDVLIPNTVKELQRAVVSINAITFFDPGPDGDISPGAAPCPPFCGTGDESPYVTQGIVLP